MKNSLLKWSYHLNRGTTWGYATRKDCLIAFGFLFLLYFTLSFLYYWVGYALGAQESVLDEYSKYLVFVLISTIIADYSMIFMRINDIFSKRYFTTKWRIFVFLMIYFLIELFGRIILKILFDMQPIDSAGYGGLLFWIVLCVYPPSSKEREEIPIIEYKLPKKTILILSFITIAIWSLLLYGAVEDSENISSSEYGKDIKAYKHETYKAYTEKMPASVFDKFSSTEIRCREYGAYFEQMQQCMENLKIEFDKYLVRVSLDTIYLDHSRKEEYDARSLELMDNGNYYFITQMNDEVTYIIDYWEALDLGEKVKGLSKDKIKTKL